MNNNLFYSFFNWDGKGKGKGKGLIGEVWGGGGGFLEIWILDQG